MRGEGTGLLEHRVNQSGLTVVNVGDDSDVTKKVILFHLKDISLDSAEKAWATFQL
jgi:hypothetical protein